MASPQGAGAGALLLSAAKAYERSGEDRAAAQGAQLDGPLPRSGPLRRDGAGERDPRRREGLGHPQDAPRGGRHHGDRPGEHRSSADSCARRRESAPGIYDREGVTAGESYSRTYTVTRTSGGNNPRTFNLSWVGNDGTFSTAASVTLPLNVATSVQVDIDPDVGGHSAILNFDDPSSPGIEFQTMNTVLAPYEFNADNGYSQAVSDSVGRGQQLHYFFRVPAGTPAFRVDLDTAASTTPGTGQIRFLRWHPYGLAIESNAVSECYVPAAAAGCAAGDPLSRTVTNPLAGVWEVTVDARRTSDADFTPFTLTGTIIGATVSPNPDLIATATIGVPVARSYTLTNVFGPVHGPGRRDRARERPHRAVHDRASRDAAVPDGCPGRGHAVPCHDRGTVGSGSGPRPLRLPLLPRLRAVGQSADGDSEESVTINNPVAATYIVLVDGFYVPRAPRRTTTSTSSPRARPSGRSRSRTRTRSGRPGRRGRCRRRHGGEAPTAGRVLAGNVEVRTDTNLLVGSGQVIVQNVTP